MKKTMILASLALSVIMIGCGNSSNDDNNKNGSISSRFSIIDMGGQKVMRDTNTSLEWTNSAGGCQPITTSGVAQSDAQNTALNYCNTSTFAGHTDWRVPTAIEGQTFINEMKSEGITPYYTNPTCPRVVGFNAEKTTLQTVNSHNTAPIGAITAWPSLRAGIRCVRAVN